MYAHGDGIPQDDVEAVNWFRVAADQGSAAAQARLGLFYLAGTGGGARDLVTAHMWFNLAASRLLETQARRRSRNSRHGDPLMTAAQVREAQRRAKEWQRSQHDNESNSAGRGHAGRSAGRPVDDGER